MPHTPKAAPTGALLLTLLLLCSLSHGQDAPKTPKQFWALSTIYGLSVVADGETTVKMARYPGCYEAANPMLYGLHPERPRFYAVSGAMAAGSILFSRQLVKSHHKSIRAIGWVILAGQTEERFRAAAGNLRFDRAVCAENPSLNGGRK